MKIEIIIDMQNDFVYGKFKNKEAQKVVRRIQQRINRNDIFIFTQDTHDKGYFDTQESKLFPIHCEINTTGWDLVPELKQFQVRENCFVVQKNTFGSAVIPFSIRSILANKRLYPSCIDEINIYGVCTDICVISNVFILKANFPDISINVISHCCAGSTQEAHKTALNAMKGAGINVK